MALMINEACTACDACEPVCPNKAIKEDLLAKYQQLHT
jgi:NAD-dependent dihydropyrimidine dehydrogenase PreA subunit